MRSANLIGYDPRTTKSKSLPIVTALIKTMSAENVPILIHVNEAVYNQNSPITLLSEYQVREFGLVVDSVATKHLSTQGTQGTGCNASYVQFRSENVRTYVRNIATFVSGHHNS